MIKDTIYCVTIDGELYTGTYNNKGIYFTTNGANKLLDKLIKDPYYNKRDLKIEIYKRL
jgi:hypothetical protein